MQLLRSCLILGAVFMLFGPLLIFRPVRKFIVTSRFGRAAVQTCQHRAARYLAFGLYLAVVAAQVVVVWALAVVLDKVFHAAVANTVGFAFCYVLVSLFYLCAFYETMLRRKFGVRGKFPLQWMRCGAPAAAARRGPAAED